MSAARQIVCFGEALIDFLAKPAIAGAPRLFEQHAGGAPANVAVAVAQLGGHAAFVGMLGSDMFGDFLAESLRIAGVSTEHVRRTDDAKTALAFVQLDRTGERSFNFYRPPAADLLFRDEHFARRVFENAAVFHICSNSLTETGIARATLHGVDRARQAGSLVSFDMNFRPALWPRNADPHSLLWETLALADVVKLSRIELDYLAAPLGGEEVVLRCLWEGLAQLVFVTDGAAPIRWYTRQGSGVVPSFRVMAIDTTAAGDAFVGGLLFHLVERGVDFSRLPQWLSDTQTLEAALRFAAAVGALAATRHGAFSAMPARTEVEHLLQEQHEHA